MANGKLDLEKDLKFGTLNAIEDANVANSGDRRRTSSLTALNATTSRTYGKNSLRRRQRFNGIVVHKKQVQTPRYANRASLLTAYVASQPLEASGGETSGSADSEAPTAGNLQPYSGAPYTIYKVYVPELEPRPAPKSFTDPVLHTYPDVMATPGRADLNGLPLGAIVQITYEDPNRLYNPQLVDGDKSKYIMMNGYEQEQANTELMFMGGVPGLLGQQSGECSEGRESLYKGSGTGTIKLSWNQLKTMRPAFDELLKYIAAHESNGNYNAVNRGVAGDTKGGSKAVVGKDLTELTIGEVLGYMKGGPNAAAAGVGGKTEASPNGTAGLFATGIYQMIPETLRGAVRSTGVDKTLLYNKNTQEVLGVYLLLTKAGRGPMSRYLLGMSNDVCLAAQHMALEWASIPVQFEYKGCARGYSAYCKGGANATTPLSRSPEEVVQLLKAAREAVRQNQAAVQIIADKGYKSEFVA
jgi:hypothetical protein